MKNVAAIAAVLALSAGVVVSASDAPDTLIYYSGRATHYGPYESDKSQDEEGFYTNGENVGCTAVSDPNNVWDYIQAQGSYTSSTQPKIVWPAVPLFAVSEAEYSYDDCWKKIVVKSTLRNTVVEGFIVDVCGESNCGWTKSIESGYVDVFGEYTWRILGGNSDNGDIAVDIMFPGSTTPQSTIQQSQSVKVSEVESAYSADSNALSNLANRVSKDGQMLSQADLSDLETAIEADMITFNQNNSNYAISDEVMAVQLLFSDIVELAVMDNDASLVDTNSQEVDSQPYTTVTDISQIHTDNWVSSCTNIITFGEGVSDGGSSYGSESSSSSSSTFPSAEYVTSNSKTNTDAVIPATDGNGLRVLPNGKTVIVQSCGAGEVCLRDDLPKGAIAVIVVFTLLSLASAGVLLFMFYKKKGPYRNRGRQGRAGDVSYMGQPQPLGSNESGLNSRSQSPARSNIRHEPFSDYKAGDAASVSTGVHKVTNKVSLK